MEARQGTGVHPGSAQVLVRRKGASGSLPFPGHQRPFLTDHWARGNEMNIHWRLKQPVVLCHLKTTLSMTVADFALLGIPQNDFQVN